jgi:hypothetical protein
MKKLFLTLAILATSAVAFSQISPVKVGIKAGVTFPAISSVSEAQAYDGPPEVDFKSITSFYIGGTIDLPVSSVFTIQPGLTLIGKGGKAQVYNSNFEPGPGLIVYQGSYKISTMYLEIPVNAVFNFELGSGKIFFGGGPYYGFALSGKISLDGITTNGTVKSETSSERDAEFGDNGDLKRGDFGLNFLAGYQLKNRVNFSAGYGLGLGNIDTEKASVSKRTNKVLSVGIGFSF